MQSIVVVSPTAPSRHFITDILKQSGFRVQSLASWMEMEDSGMDPGAQALYILDHSLGNERVINILNTIQAASGESKIPVMVVSASSRAEDVLALSNHGVNDYYLKPVEPDVFIMRVKRLLELFPSQQEPQYPDSLELDVDRLINFEIARARRGNYPFSIIQLTVDPDGAIQKPIADPVEMMNTCYETLRPKFRETDILIGTGDRLVVLCPFADRMGTRVVLRKIISHLNQYEEFYPLDVLEVGHATYPYDGRDQGGLWTYASANKEPLAYLAL